MPRCCPSNLTRWQSGRGLVASSLPSMHISWATAPVRVSARWRDRGTQASPKLLNTGMRLRTVSISGHPHFHVRAPVETVPIVAPHDADHLAGLSILRAIASSDTLGTLQGPADGLQGRARLFCVAQYRIGRSGVRVSFLQNARSDDVPRETFVEPGSKERFFARDSIAARKAIWTKGDLPQDLIAELRPDCLGRPQPERVEEIRRPATGLLRRGTLYVPVNRP
jgi:hypothetical protein